MRTTTSLLGWALKNSSKFGKQCPTEFWSKGNATVVAWDGDVLIWAGRMVQSNAPSTTELRAGNRAPRFSQCWRMHVRFCRSCTHLRPAQVLQTPAGGSPQPSPEEPLTNNSCFSTSHAGLSPLLERGFTVASTEEIRNYFSALCLGRKALTFWHMVRY